MEELNNLIESYESKVKELKYLLEIALFDSEKERLKIKLGNYRGFLTDLKNAKKSASMF